MPRERVGPKLLRHREVPTALEHLGELEHQLSNYLDEVLPVVLNVCLRQIRPYLTGEKGGNDWPNLRQFGTYRFTRKVEPVAHMLTDLAVAFEGLNRESEVKIAYETEPDGVRVDVGVGTLRLTGTGLGLTDPAGEPVRLYGEAAEADLAIQITRRLLALTGEENQTIEAVGHDIQRLDDTREALVSQIQRTIDAEARDVVERPWSDESLAGQRKHDQAGQGTSFQFEQGVDAELLEILDRKFYELFLCAGGDLSPLAGGAVSVGRDAEGNPTLLIFDSDGQVGLDLRLLQVGKELTVSRGGVDDPEKISVDHRVALQAVSQIISAFGAFSERARTADDKKE